MPNPITDGRLLGERPGWLERAAAAGVTVAILAAARALGVLSWPRIGWALPIVTITATVAVWFPEFVAGLASASSADRDDVPTTAVRATGWGVLGAIALALGATWCALR